ncbi:MAG: hypothetical protein IPM97_08725 [Bdellovibrionaceae bacterium]|nr:hypothetical protein [Pseudobdellovibrionaceae bacterium]
MHRILIGIILLLFSIQTYGFSENVSHGYVNCMACHVAPSGGGLLNDYGRSLSGELMSTWGWKNSDQPLFGAVQNAEWLKVGGDYRAIQTYLENSQVKQGKQFTMQKNVELGFNFSKLWLVGTLGTQEGPTGTPNKGDFLSERHYILWDITDEIKLRAGKFRLNFGLNDANHTRATKQPLGFGSNSETYILEFSKFTETDEIFISADLGRIDIPRNSAKETSISLNYAKYTSEKSKVGTSFLFGESGSRRRSLLGIYGVIGFLEHFILKNEVDYQQSFAAALPNERKDLVSSVLSFGYQATKGLVPYFVVEHLQQDLTDESTQQSSAGLGIQWLPIPHIELQAEFKKLTNKSAQVSQSDSGWILFHFYL